MAETRTVASQVQQFAGENVKKLFEEQSTRMTQAFEELGKAHSKWIEYGNTQIDEMNELMKTQFNYFNELAGSMRKLTLETAQKTAQQTAETFKS
jgi:glutaredoxin 2